VGGAPTTVTMTRSGAPDEWIGEIAAQPHGTEVHYFLDATDSKGNTERLPAEGVFTFEVGTHDRIFFDDFEGGAGAWTHGGTNDDFELGTPAGKSTDPAAAFSGVNCFGKDRKSTRLNSSHAN